MRRSSILFLSTPSARRATIVHLDVVRRRQRFLSTPSARRATVQLAAGPHFRGISIHALREEGDPLSGPRRSSPCFISIHALREEGDLRECSSRERRCRFLSTPSARRATGRGSTGSASSVGFLSTPSARRATGPFRSPFPSVRISIHALREEGDTNIFEGGGDTSDFYPRPPRGGRREDVRVSRQRRGISIHALREEGDGLELRGRFGAVISIHALREEGDEHIADRDFQVVISIHALREEGDCGSMVLSSTILDFYPRPPRGGRPRRRGLSADREAISIHALREEGDLQGAGWPLCRPYFYPRPPRGGRQPQHRRFYNAQTISIHALREEGDGPAPAHTGHTKTFLSTPSARRATR